MNGRWRTGAIFDEARRNALLWRSRQSIAIAVSILLGLGLALTSASDWHTLSRNIESLDLRGRNVLIAQATDPASPAEISIASCEATSELLAVERAGAVVALDSTNVTQLGPRVPLVGVSPSLLPELDHVAAVVGSSLGLAPGDITLVVEGEVLTARVGQPQPEAFGLNSAVAVRVPFTTTWTRQCVIELGDSESVTRQAALISAQLRTDGGDIAVTPYVNETFDILQAFGSRPTRWVPLGFGLLGLILGGALLSMRSSELAAYRLSGTSRRDLVILLAAEQALLAGVTVAFGSFGCVIALLVVPTMPLTTLLWPWVTGLTSLVGFWFVAYFATRRSPAVLARDR
ncbi:MAG: hypothetical protein ABIR17_11670 [Pseudolysinimonas sp.]|uniref:hypothetical protein n=1 Tax=Pseudolysinimonas sp. TaxID=2680009 RepID=UPI00326714AE